ncbi:MAG: HypC/HybG/HupF family hydrogenase formation chaperone [Gammaproteobacteria bacterium]|nr:HypC/HybG/HupF family hydrogenase formation chaperone [Gammaproteobacteria bacterium]
MCLAMPAEIIQKKINNRAIVNLGGIEKEISTALIDDVKVGDYVVIHVGYALTILDEIEAKKTLALFSEMQKLDLRK